MVSMLAYRRIRKAASGKPTDTAGKEDWEETAGRHCKWARGEIDRWLVFIM
jgi:hypothetical protein